MRPQVGFFDQCLSIVSSIGTNWFLCKRWFLGFDTRFFVLYSCNGNKISIYCLESNLLEVACSKTKLASFSPKSRHYYRYILVPIFLWSTWILKISMCKKNWEFKSYIVKNPNRRIFYFYFFDTKRKLYSNMKQHTTNTKWSLTTASQRTITISSKAPWAIKLIQNIISLPWSSCNLNVKGNPNIVVYIFKISYQTSLNDKLCLDNQLKIK